MAQQVLAFGKEENHKTSVTPLVHCKMTIQPAGESIPSLA